MHNASRGSAAAHLDAWYIASPAARPEHRVREHHRIQQHLATFARPSLFVYHDNVSAWQPFASEALVTAVVSDECTWLVRKRNLMNITHIHKDIAQYHNLYCSLILMRATEEAKGVFHDYVARMRPDFPVEITASFLQSDERLVVSTINTIQDPSRRIGVEKCTTEMWPTDQFFMGHNRAVSTLLESMVNVSRYQERYLFVYMAIHQLSFTLVRARIAADGNATSTDDLVMIVNGRGIHCQIQKGGTPATALRPTCSFRPWDPTRLLKRMPQSSLGLMSCVHRNDTRSAGPGRGSRRLLR